MVEPARFNIGKMPFDRVTLMNEVALFKTERTLVIALQLAVVPSVLRNLFAFPVCDGKPEKFAQALPL